MKKYRLIIVCLLMVLALLLFNLWNRNRKSILETFNMDLTTKEEITNELVTPQVGAHNPLGYDELAYRVDSSGNKELVAYEHLKSFGVPRKF